MFKMALPRLETIGFRAAVHKPMGDVTDVTSISFIQSVDTPHQYGPGCKLKSSKAFPNGVYMNTNKLTDEQLCRFSCRRFGAAAKTGVKSTFGVCLGKFDFKHIFFLAVC